jgi:hypothetical protein
MKFGWAGRLLWAGAVLATSIVAPGCDEVLLADGKVSSADAQSSVLPQPAVGRESHGIFFPIGAGSFHADLGCSDCHANPDTIKEFTSVSCHAHDEDAAKARHTFITGYTWKSEECRRCHPVGQEADIPRADHSLKYFGIASGSHAKFECSDCHPFKTTAKTFKCVPCHEPSGPGAKAHASTPKYRYDSFACYGCHPGR